MTPDDGLSVTGVIGYPPTPHTAEGALPTSKVTKVPDMPDHHDEGIYAEDTSAQILRMIPGATVVSQ